MKIPKSLPFFFLFAGIIFAMIWETVTFGSPSRWSGHAITGGIGLVLLVLVIITGAMQGGRLPSLHFRHTLLVHKIASVSFSAIATGTFLLGLLVMVGHGWPVLATTHGVLGLIVTVLSIIQIVPSLLVTSRQSIRGIHRFVGYLILPLFLLQIFLGLEAADLLEFLFES
jgi:hypothetical protein